ncbi:Uncharacterized protein BM_BM1480 [Brugia malayi]|uniref:Bm1480, isoform d n=1 Tax=Brugia malayi TaxID=6279 RepID=A0A4E9F5Q9_BRUMA|nr:Uncharacterized protein BM_BM1480 [Brugia malayi]VIO91620.1 Uncharacterized protein BM_BM1480 [Brugia malayi]
MHKMADCQIRKDAYKDIGELKSKKGSARKKLDKNEIANKPVSNDKLKKKEQAHFQLKASLLETSKVTLNIVEITQDSTLCSQKCSNDGLLNKYSTVSSPLSKTKYSREVETSTGSANVGPFSEIKRNIMKKQKDSITFDEFDSALAS